MRAAWKGKEPRKFALEVSWWSALVGAANLRIAAFRRQGVATSHRGLISREPGWIFGERLVVAFERHGRRRREEMKASEFGRR